MGKTSTARSTVGAAPATSAAADAAPFLCFSGQDWWYHNRAHSDFQLMTRLSRTRRVLLINSIGMRMPLPGRSTAVLERVTRKLGSMMRFLRRPVRGLPDYWVMTPLLLPFYGMPSLRRLNAVLVRFQVTAAMRRIGMVNPHVVVTIPTAFDVVQGMHHRTLTYNRSDRHSAFGEADSKVIRDLELGLLAAADTVLYVSRELMAEEAALCGDRAHFLDHGVDVQHFRRRDRGDEPADLRGIPRPRLGYFGGLDDYTVDFDLIDKLARELPEAHVVLVGRAMGSLDRLKRHTNVHCLGFKPYESIPAYGSGFDLALMPWQRNEWINNCNPIKLKEYLALGLGVVSTSFPEVRHYANWVRIADDADDFVTKVRLSLTDGGLTTQATRRAAVAGDTWEARAEELLAAVGSAVRGCVAV
jgi:glycosyltransferase involved in cell wall biosynthesis